MSEVFTIAHLDDESIWARSVKRNLAEIGTKSRTNIELIQADNLEFFLYGIQNRALSAIILDGRFPLVPGGDIDLNVTHAVDGIQSSGFESIPIFVLTSEIPKIRDSRVRKYFQKGNTFETLKSILGTMDALK